MKKLLAISFTLLANIAFGQSKADRELIKFLKSNKLDTFIIITSGCSSCIISYEFTDKIINADTVGIALLYQKKGNQTFIMFSDTIQKTTMTNLETDIFTNIADNLQVLRTKDKYYQEQKHAKFQSPCLVTFPYETIDIKFGDFNYRHTLVTRESDDCGTVLTHKNWFKVEVEILSMVDKLKNVERR